MALTKKQLAHLEKRLLDERARALKALGLFDEMAKADRESGDSDLAAYTDHMADQGTEAMEREKAAAFATKEGRYLYRLEEALRRLYNDPKNFGDVPHLRVGRGLRPAGCAAARAVLHRLQAKKEESACLACAPPCSRSQPARLMTSSRSSPEDVGSATSASRRRRAAARDWSAAARDLQQHRVREQRAPRQAELLRLAVPHVLRRSASSSTSGERPALAGACGLG